MAGMTGVSVFETQVKPSARARVWRVIGIVLGVLITLAVVAGLTELSIYLLYYSWQIGDFTNFWMSVGATAFVELLLVPIIGVAIFSGRAFGGVTVRAIRELDELVRRFLLAANDESAPPEPLQPAPLALPQGPNTTLTIPGTAVSAATASSTRIARVLVSLLSAVFIVPFFVIEIFTFPGSPPPPLPILGGLGQLGFLTYLLPCGGIALTMFIGIVASIRTSLRRTARGKPVQVSDEGLRWTDPRTRQQVSLRWGEIRVIARSSAPSVVQNTTTIAPTYYMITGENQTLSWSVSATTRPLLFQGSENLLRITVTRTGLPLRDATKLVTEITQAGRNARFLLESRLAGSSTGVPTLATPTQRKRMGPAAWGCLGMSLLLVVLLLVQGGLGVAGYTYQQQRSTYMTNLPQLIHQTKPLFADSFNSADTMWPVQKPGKDNYMGMAFTPSGYELTGTRPGYFVLATEPNTYGTNVAYTVVATQTGALTDNGGDGVGLIFNESNQTNGDPNEFLLFMVGFDGSWNLTHYKYVDDRGSDNWTYVDSGTSSTINKQSGVPNTLLIVVRDKQYILYINNQYITTYNDTYLKGLPTSGKAGVFLDDCSLTGDFQYFNVYAVKPVTTQDFSIV